MNKPSVTAAPNSYAGGQSADRLRLRAFPAPIIPAGRVSVGVAHQPLDNYNVGAGDLLDAGTTPTPTSWILLA